MSDSTINDKSDIVEFEKDDPLEPHNWPTKKKVILTTYLGFTTFTAVIGSSIISPVNMEISRRYNIGQYTAALDVTLYVAGFGLGPLVGAPISDVVGRKYPILLAQFLQFVFAIGTGRAEDITSLMILRFFGGLAAGVPIVLNPTMLAEFWDRKRIGPAVVSYGTNVLTGSLLGPLLGFLIAGNPQVSYRWSEWITALLFAVTFILGFFIMDETLVPVILKGKAAALRRSTGNYALHAKAEENPINFNSLIHKYFYRPIIMMSTEPILLLITVYMSFVYGILYGSLVALPFIFLETRMWSPQVTGTTFMTYLVGSYFGSIAVLLFMKRYNRFLEKNRGFPVPEQRLLPAMIGAITFPVGLFMLGWGIRTSPAVQLVGGLFIGFSFFVIFLQGINYIVDCYQPEYIASATAVRAFVAAPFPLFITQMFKNLGIEWAASTLAFISLALAPCPFLFFFYGKKLRNISKFAADWEKISAEQADKENEKLENDGSVEKEAERLERDKSLPKDA